MLKALHREMHHGQVGASGGWQSVPAHQLDHAHLVGLALERCCHLHLSAPRRGAQEGGGNCLFVYCTP